MPQADSRLHHTPSLKQQPSRRRALRIEESTVEIGIAPERVILDVRGAHFDTEGHRFTNGVVALSIRDLDLLLGELEEARETALALPSPQPGLWSFVRAHLPAMRRAA